MPYTIRPRPSADSTVPTRSSRAPSSAGVSAMRRVSAKMISTTRTSPTNTHRQEQVGGEQAADQRPGRHRDRAGRGDQPVGARALITREVRRDQRDDRRHDQRGPGTFQHRPAHDQHGQVRRQRGGQRPAPVDDAPDREGALAAEDLAELAAGDHERGHHQRVEGDRGLDPGHRRADVLGHGGDRHVHDRAVQRHQELRRGQRQQHDPARRSRTFSGAARYGLPAYIHAASPIQATDNKRTSSHVTDGRPLSGPAAAGLPPAPHP